MIMRLTMTMLITMVTVRNTVVGPMPPTRRREKEAQIGFSCNLCGTEFIGDVKLKSQNVSNWNYYYIFNYYIVKLKRQNDPQMVTQLVPKSILHSYAEIQLRFQFFVAFLKLGSSYKNMFSANFDLFSLSKSSSKDPGDGTLRWRMMSNSEISLSTFLLGIRKKRSFTRTELCQKYLHIA